MAAILASSSFVCSLVSFGSLGCRLSIGLGGTTNIGSTKGSPDTTLSDVARFTVEVRRGLSERVTNSSAAVGAKMSVGLAEKDTGASWVSDGLAGTCAVIGWSSDGWLSDGLAGTCAVIGWSSDGWLSDGLAEITLGTDVASPRLCNNKDFVFLI